MEIRMLELIEGAKQAKGLTVIIDVFRAFSAACYVMEAGAQRILPVGAIEDAYRLKEVQPDWVLMGERGGVVQPGFDFGNSPKQVLEADLRGKTVVHTTSAGTQGIVLATGADEIITGSFVNAGAIVQYIQRANPETVSLVSMGLGGVKPADEDRLCAEYLRNALRGEPNDFPSIVHYMAHESKTGGFLDLQQEASAPKEDFDLCLQLDRFDFVLRAIPWDGTQVCFERIYI
jgi:2-phosphosulfolactate phosphatase